VDDVYYNIKKSFNRKVRDVTDRVSGAVDSTKENAKEYCDAGLNKMNGLIDEVKREREKFLGKGHALKPDQERELEGVCLIIYEYQFFEEIFYLVSSAISG
jgi:hypothetical protein